MELLTTELPRTHRIVLAGDLHFGTRACYLKGFEAMLERVQRERNTYLILMGDLIEAISVDDPRFDPAVHDGKAPLQQAAIVADMLRPVRRKILSCLTGNHEMKLFRFGDITKYICELAEIPYGGYSCKLTIKHSGETLYKLFATHGRLSVNSIADDPVRRLSNHKLSVKRKLQHLAGDVAAMVCGHTHKLLVLEPASELFLTDDGSHLHAHYTEGVQSGGYIPPDLRWYINSGSFLKSSIVGACSYSEMAGYSPLQMGYSILHVNNGVIEKATQEHVG